MLILTGTKPQPAGSFLNVNGAYASHLPVDPRPPDHFLIIPPAIRMPMYFR